MFFADSWAIGPAVGSIRPSMEHNKDFKNLRWVCLKTAYILSYLIILHIYYYSYIYNYIANVKPFDLPFYLPIAMSLTPRPPSLEGTRRTAARVMAGQFPQIT